MTLRASSDWQSDFCSICFAPFAILGDRTLELAEIARVANAESRADCHGESWLQPRSNVNELQSVFFEAKADVQL